MKKLRNQMAEKYSWKKLGSISPCFDDEFLKVEGPKNILRKKWAAFCNMLRPVTFEVTSYVRDGPVIHALKPWGFHRPPQRINASVCLSQRSSATSETVTIRQKWVTIPPALITSILQSNGRERSLKKIGQHFPLF